MDRTPPHVPVPDAITTTVPGINSAYPVAVRSPQFEESRKINLVQSEEEKKVKLPFYPQERSRRFERQVKNDSSNIFLLKFNYEEENPENNHKQSTTINDTQYKPSLSAHNRVQTKKSIASNRYNISKRNRKFNNFNQKSANNILLVPSTKEKFWNSKINIFTLPLFQQKITNLENPAQLVSSTQKKTKDFGNPTKLIPSIQNEIKISESAILPFSSTRDKNRSVGNAIYSIMSTQGTIQNREGIASTMPYTPVHESNENMTQKTDSFKVKRAEQQTNIISNLNLQSLIDAVQKELGTIASAEKKTNNFDDVKELIIINPDSKLKIVPRDGNATEFSKPGTKTLKDATTQKSLVVIWLISCAVLFKIVITILIVYFLRLVRKRRKSQYNLLPKKNSKKQKAPTQIKKNGSSEKLLNAEQTLKHAMEKCLKSCKIHRKEDLEKAYSNSKHMGMIRNILEYRT
ncbi:hypothetical protein AVEN_246465-1 [Araneus ventricosus]|uniref:Uncharacterized protein n=1 Tax=Araneus ventricosus TaxID=182803 RepID=A0A4Y2EPI4_ARAVE|nr:hypothetical protein AVEN_246465-1 [Araneus ventricosus]